MHQKSFLQLLQNTDELVINSSRNIKKYFLEINKNEWYWRLPVIEPAEMIIQTDELFWARLYIWLISSSELSLILFLLNEVEYVGVCIEFWGQKPTYSINGFSPPNENGILFSWTEERIRAIGLRTIFPYKKFQVINPSDKF